MAAGAAEPPPAAPAAAGTPIVSGPGAFATNYATPVARCRRAAASRYTQPRRRLTTTCSSADGLFGTPLIGPGQSAPVAGVEALAPGDYGFYCSLHANMRGTITVTA